MVNLHHLKVHMGKIHSNSTRKHLSSGEVPKVLQKDTRPMKSSTVRRYSSTSDGQSAPSKGPHGEMRRNNARKHSSSGEVPKVPQKDTRPRNSTAVERYSNTSDGQSTL